MAKNKDDNPKPKDQHKSKFMVRLPEKFRAPLKMLHEKYRRSTTTEVQIALEKHFKDERIPLPLSDE